MKTEKSQTTVSKQLRRKTDFEQEEWNNFSIPDLDKDDFILCGDAYFKPAGTTSPTLGGHDQQVSSRLVLRAPLLSKNTTA